MLLIGDDRHASHYDSLYEIGVTHVCNLDFKSRNYFEGKFIYVRFNLQDSPDEKLLPHFHGVNQFLDATERIGGRVLLHCKAGNALSPAFAIAYLMGIKQMKFDEALQLVQSKRPAMVLHPNFRSQLLQYEVRT